ncbi:hypothetical protein [Georgenia sunbinii]|uniref:hypothetical protein n=1 Tax=Georgenia sunbinii TaxID=3117728 RepID=UPI002F264698
MSRTTDLISALNRRARRLPVGQKSAGRLAVRLRSSRTARTVVSRMFDFDDAGLGGTSFLAAGNVIGGLGLDNLPVVLVSLVGAAPRDVPALLERVAQEQVLTGGFRPVIVLDSDHFAEVRQYGYPVDFVVPQSAWTDTTTAWPAYFRDRLRSMRRGYSAVGLVDLRETDGLGLDILASMDRGA